MTGWESFGAYAAKQYDAPDTDYAALWKWSIDNVARFWRALWEYFDVGGTGLADGDAGVLVKPSMPGAQWFPGVQLNYVDQVLRHTDRQGPAIIGVDEAGVRTSVDWRELPGRVGAVADELRRLGVGRGDTVGAYLPDNADAMIAFLATAAVGAVWSGCGQDYAPEGAAARLGQLNPKVLFAADGYRYNGRWIDKRADTAALLSLLPGPPRLVVDLPTGSGPLDVEAVAFDHPLWVLFSSGTTGKPKGIMHGHGGVLLEHLKAAGLHADLGSDDVFFWQTALSWMMWNFRLAGLLVGSTVVCYGGHPLHPDADRLWELVAEEKVTYFGTSPGHLQASRKAGLVPAELHDLSRLKTVGSTGSPLPPDLFEWIGAHVGEDVAVSSISGGTDVCTAFAGGTTGVPAVAGELPVRYLGVDLRSWSQDRRDLVGEVGEMVILAPMPSMPVAFWNDPDGTRYRAAYFEHEWADGTAPGVWRHGDWVTVTERGSLVIHGRSDATLNRHGIRMGSADIYEVVEAIDEVVEAFVIGVDGPDGAYWMPLFVTLVPGSRLDDALVDKIRQQIRTRLSPRHVPDEVIEAPGIPHTRTGKKLEVPICGILAGRTDVSLDQRSIDNPDLIDWYRAQGSAHRW
ncbi:MAG: acetoacetate--CoA ligase [Mycobacteriaceae bacterium]|nr:acetoacetate--CoA ligase [Mycobacteriaceae bacterium]